MPLVVQGAFKHLSMKTIFRVVETRMGDGTIHFMPQKIHPKKGDETILDGLIWQSMWAHPLNTLEMANRDH